ncbi:hypothetical protein I7I50_02594 [Histoplasma capsulatum G186AR]|uniref:Uncharacterized protein n=1 Tax=Ajellomyces capsulatus TaxID=5037 RepID=A0A8H7Z2H2_AJECA|nr:hypothetical protein I7I52_00743 [Histoplasma capsulatum]QSS71666.1 hypothetical protein I7I50_02594 [Histoplasma capsulatum G186AR]
MDTAAIQIEFPFVLFICWPDEATSQAFGTKGVFKRFLFFFNTSKQTIRILQITFSYYPNPSSKLIHVHPFPSHFRG